MSSAFLPLSLGGYFWSNVQHIQWLNPPYLEVGYITPTKHLTPNFTSLLTELWLAPLQLARATSAATFLVAPGLAPLAFWPLLSAALIASFIFQRNNFFNITAEHGLVNHLYETGVMHVQPLLQLLGNFDSYSLSFVKNMYIGCCLCGKTIGPGID